MTFELICAFKVGVIPLHCRSYRGKGPIILFLQERRYRSQLISRVFFAYNTKTSISHPPSSTSPIPVGNLNGSHPRLTRRTLRLRRRAKSSPEHFSTTLFIIRPDSGWFPGHLSPKSIDRPGILAGRSVGMTDAICL